MHCQDTARCKEIQGSAIWYNKAVHGGAIHDTVRCKSDPRQCNAVQQGSARSVHCQDTMQVQKRLKAVQPRHERQQPQEYPLDQGIETDKRKEEDSYKFERQYYRLGLLRSSNPSAMASTSSSAAAAAAGVVVADAAAADPLVHVAFNQQGTHFVAATETGFHVFSCEPLERVMHRSGLTVTSPGGMVSSAELLTRSQLAVVTSRPNEDDAIDFWNGMCKEGKVASVTSSHHRTVGGIRLQGEYMLVAGEEKARLYFGGSREKDVRRRRTPGSVDVRAHDSAVACMALSRDGRLLATAGTRGTLVRVFSTADGSKLQELRRGTEGATIHCIAFSPDSKWLAVTSDRTTVHVFKLGDFDLTTSSPEDGGDFVLLPASPMTSPSAKQGSSLSFLKGYLPTYFSSEWSFAHFRVRKATKYSIAFDQQRPNTITIVGVDTSFYRCEFDPVKGGAMRELKYCRNFMDASTK
ncbi:autophagy-related protein 18d-like [Lolium rigidum]|uniref:autophagy-related protein 18d-like n=1 Tax=Lolium rigidum TaxID=89674 RepID=UPI001F5C3931|nr:autophagy-related protein 18d-like [Lolium rigidum]